MWSAPPASASPPPRKAAARSSRSPVKSASASRAWSRRSPNRWPSRDLTSSPARASPMAVTRRTPCGSSLCARWPKAAYSHPTRRPIGAELVGAPVFGSGWTASLDAQTRQRRLFDAAVSLVRHRAHHAPLLLVIDDAQWIDSASLDLLNHLVARIGDARVVLLVASRSERKWSGWADLPNAAEIVLQPLDRPAIETMIADLLGIDDRRLPLAVRTLLERMAAGGVSATPDAAPASALGRY